MQLRTLTPIFISALLATGSCSSDAKKKAEETKSGETAAASASAPASAPASAILSPADTKQANELWSLAPAGAIIGGVAVPGSGARMHGMLLEIIRTVEARPAGKKLVAEAREGAESLPFDFFIPGSLKSVGLDLDKGAAFFLVDPDKGGYAILPVVDRDKFRKLTGGKLVKMEGIELDRHDADLLCRNQADLYLCASTVEELKAFGKPVHGDLAKRVAALPGKYRGDVELAVDVEATQKMAPSQDISDHFSEVDLGVGALRFGGGALSARMYFKAKPKDILADSVAVPSTLAKSILKKNPAAMLRARIPTALFKMSTAKNDNAIPGISLKDDIFGTMTGEFIAFVPYSKTTWGRLALGLTEKKGFESLISMGCGAARMVPGINAILENGKCTAAIDVSKLSIASPELAKMFPAPIEVAVDAKADQFAFTLGKESASDASPPRGVIGDEMLEQDWNFAIWAQNMSIAQVLNQSWPSLAKEIPLEATEPAELGMWMLSHVFEFGFAGGIRDDGIHGLVYVATYAGDPPETYMAFETALGKSLDGVAATDDFTAIAKQWPESMAGRQSASAGTGSLMAAGLGVFAGIGIPAGLAYWMLATQEEPPPEPQAGGPQMAPKQ